ncbi:hypothetical protein [Antarctobacter heliothermus]|uniref:Transmembrane protein n=1 Tax=Antarctobacter heliothermus TaxID=74033 RepID=A0A239HXU5_9RHOB|nr:hypothetical protein [Antarctobacter heliothermus]SNS86062.1 hypothetical protein SAMN04488078_103745 [Antarctobacter heliothermus]
MNAELATALIIAAILIAGSAFGLPEALGAHPFWAVKTGAIGSVAGLLAYGGLRWAGMRSGRMAALGGLTLILAMVAVTQGKSIFAASYAENAVAGLVWFFGWFVVMAALCMTLCALAARVLRR